MGYIDPNTGGMLFQILAAGFALLSGVVLIFARQIRMAFSRLKRALRGHSSSDNSQEQDKV
jgi:hypothetical protein